MFQELFAPEFDDQTKNSSEFSYFHPFFFNFSYIRNKNINIIYMIFNII